MLIVTKLLTLVGAVIVVTVGLQEHRPFSCWMWPVITVVWMLNAHVMYRMWQRAIDN